jgi:FMN-dependent NADH-azoreductase
VTGTFTPADARSDAQNEALSFSDTLVAEVIAADTIVIGTPIYNFGAPAVLKAWIDQIARAGVTFQYTENGPEGLLEGKKVIIAVASGGTQIGSDYDFASPYLKFALGFLGITDVTVLSKDDILNEEAA